MGPGGGPYISNDMGPPGPMSLGKWSRGAHFTTTPIGTVSSQELTCLSIEVATVKLSEKKWYGGKKTRRLLFHLIILSLQSGGTATNVKVAIRCRPFIGELSVRSHHKM